MPAEGKKLVADVRDSYAKATAAHPEFTGKTATFAQGSPYEGELYVYQAGLNTEFLTYLGFTITPGPEKFSPEPGSQAQISAENLDRIDADAIVFATEKAADIAALEGMTTFDALAAVKGKRAVYTNATLAGAIYFMTPLALTYVVDNLTPRLVSALAGASPRSIV